jgi:hypothetical protein
MLVLHMSVDSYETMNLLQKHRVLASLNQASRNLLEILSDGTELDECDQSYIQSHLRLMELTYGNWKNGPIEQSISKADVRPAA